MGESKTYEHYLAGILTSKKKPTVIITDTAGTLYEGAIFYNDDNNLTITFSAPFNGYADLN